MTLGAAVPLAPALGAGVVTLTLAVAFVVALGLKVAYDGTLSKIAQWLADKLDDISTRVLGGVADAIREVDGGISSALGYLVKQTEGGVAYFWDKVAFTFDALGNQIAGLAEDAAAAHEWVWRTLVPRAQEQTLGQARRIAVPIRADVARLTTVAIPSLAGRIGGLTDRIGRLGRDLASYRPRVGRLEKAVFGAGIVALGLRMLSRLKLGWLRCGLLRSRGPKICAIDTTLFDALLASTALMFGTYSLVQFAEEMQEVTEEVAPLIQRFWRAT